MTCSPVCTLRRPLRRRNSKRKAMLAILATIPAIASAQNLPKIDFEALGSVGIAGNFAGLQVWDESYARTYKALNASAEDSSSVWSRNTEGHLEYLGSTNEGGSISALCQSLKDSDAKGLLFLAGNFTSINGTEASHIASYDPTANSFASLGSGLDGPVLALACDDDANTLYAGGTFTGPNDASDSYGGSVASWSYSDQAWSPLPFGGLDGTVFSIEPASPSDNSRSVFFGGNFTLSLSNSNTSSISNSSENYPSLGSALSPIPLGSSSVWAGPGGTGDPNQLFCPQGDGPTGSNWLAPGRDAAIIVVRTDNAHQVGGLRIGNTFKNNRGTSQFKVISVPDSIVQTFTYRSDPTDPDSSTATCSWECPLSNDPSVVYEDFLFQPGTNITGFQIDLDGFYGDGAGLHQVTLLSTGGVALADSSNSSASCNTGVAAASSTSSSTQNGDWTSTTVTSSISGVTESALVAPVDAGTTQDDSPSVTFRPSIVSATAYDVYLITPGCAAMGDCISRTSVEIATDSGTGTAHSATVSQTNEQEQSALVYSGDLSPDASFTLRLASGADGSSSGDSYSLVAYKLQVVAQDTSASRIADTPGRAIYEYVLPGSTGAFGDGQAAASSNTNITANAITNATAFDQLAASLNHTATSVHALVFSDSTVYFGGAFNSSDNVTTANIASFNGDLDAEPVVPNRGLNGPVRALLIIDDHLYAAGSFNATADGSIDELNGLAKWKVGSSDSWAALQGGDVPRFTEVVGLAPTKIEDDDALLAVAQQSDSADSAALGIYNIRSERWDASALPFIAGSSSAVAASAVDEGSIYFTGRITQALSSSASGASRLTTNSSGYPTLDSYGFDFSANADGASSTSTRQQKRATRTYNVFSKRATTEVTGLPTPISNDANAQILAGAFYKNGSDDLTILGGRYQTEESVSNIGIYNSDSQSLSPLASDNPIDGVVRALRVVDDTLWIGGQFTAQDGSIGLTRYELDNGKWSSFSSPVQAYDDTNVTVTSLLTTSANSTNVIVAGSFAAIGSLSCASICSYDSDNDQWNAFGAGLNGYVAALDFGGDDSRYIFAAGSFSLDGQDLSVARWDMKDLKWSTLGPADALPGPATALATDDQDEDRLFVAGVSSEESAQPFLMEWDGSSWTDLSRDTLQSGSEFSQIAFVPLSSNTKDGDKDVIEQDRMLMVSGDLDFSEYGRVSSALFDGSNWMPFLVSATSAGGTGIVAALFYSAEHFRLSTDHLSVGIVILISIAIALGVVFLVVLIGLLLALKNRKADQKAAYPAAGRYNKDEDVIEEKGRRPTSLLATLNAATALVAADGATKSAAAKRETGPSQYDDDARSVGSDHLPMAGAAPARQSGSSDDHFFEADGMVDEDEEIVRMRYSFEAEQPGELTVNANEELRVLDRSSEEWYFAERLDGSNERGVVPASFLY